MGQFNLELKWEAEYHINERLKLELPKNANQWSKGVGGVAQRIYDGGQGATFPMDGEDFEKFLKSKLKKFKGTVVIREVNSNTLSLAERVTSFTTAYDAVVVTASLVFSFA